MSWETNLTMNKQFPTESVRNSLAAIPTEVAHDSIEPPPPSQIFVVSGHEGAVDPDTPLVVGDRGTGKSFWSAALTGAVARKLIGTEFKRIDLSAVDVSWGFSAAAAPLGYPSKRVLSELCEAGFNCETIWRTVVLHQLAQGSDTNLPGDNWPARVRYVAESAEREELLLREIVALLRKSHRRHLLVFDALDRCGDSWEEIRPRVKALLRVCLDLRAENAIRLKLFMRTDMWEDRAIWAFPDSSKLQHGRVILQWRRTDLYGLLWHWLANRLDSSFRDWCAEKYRLAFEVVSAKSETAYSVPKKLRSDEDTQSKLLLELASPYMGRDRRRGKTYSWLPNHLADAKGQVSPRSFLLALRTAETVSRQRGGKEVIHYEGLKEGVREASTIRISELREDYPWIELLLAPLSGMTVPCTEKELKERWSEAEVLDKIESERKDALKQDRNYLPPHPSEQNTAGEETLITRLIEIGILSSPRR